MIGIIGSTGFVGQSFCRVLKKLSLPILPIRYSLIQFNDPQILYDYLTANPVTFLINCAGFTGNPNVDACELAKLETLQGNAILPGIIREVCEDLNIPWGHVSSGCIYSGRRSDGRGWAENDEPNFSFRFPPCSFYSGTKVLGEEVLEGAENCFIWRLRIPFNQQTSPKNYLQKLLHYDKLVDVENSVSHLEEFCLKCVECFINDIEPGIYNMTNSGSVSTRQVVQWMIQEGLTDKKFNFFKTEEEFMEKAAKTPRSNCVLDTTKAEKAGIGMSPVEEAIIDSIRKMPQSVLL